MAASIQEAQSQEVVHAPSMVALARCRTLIDPMTRLACFDRSVAALDSAEAVDKGVVIDQSKISRARNLMQRGARANTSFEEGRNPSQIELTLAAASVDDAGQWTFQLNDGTRWKQIDDNIIARRPRTRDKVILKRAALGSFRLSVGGRPGVKVRLQN